MDVIEKKIDGRTKAARALRATQQPREAEPAPTRRAPSNSAARLGIRPDNPQDNAPRVAARGSQRGIVARGRDGEELTRKRTSVGDPFHIPPELIEPGWDMQWIAHSVVGNTEVVLDQNLNMMENGWRPVNADRFPGRFMPAGHSGHIIRGGQGLYERPMALSKEAKAEDLRLARQLISDRNDALKLTGVKKGLPDGFAMNQKYRGTGGDVRMNIDRAVDIPTPSYTLAESGE